MRLTTAARFGQAAWFFGNLYEGLVGVPQLLADARAHRAAGLVGPGSPVRYFAPVGPLAIGTTTATLVRSARTGGDRRLIATTALGMAAAIGLTGYLVRSVNVHLLRSATPLSEQDRRRMIATWHATNAVRLAALAVASTAFSRLAPCPSAT
jgi:hypothetical protein